jgi:hypothetical protein
VVILNVELIKMNIESQDKKVSFCSGEPKLIEKNMPRIENLGIL